MITIDEKTGLPALPEGYFWHVRRDYEGDYRITIRRGINYLLSYKVEGGYILNHPLTRESLSRRALEIYTRWSPRQSYTKEANELLGSYPPKSLNRKG